MKTQIFSLTTRITRPATDVFAWHERPGALARLCPPWERIKLVSSTGGVRDGTRVIVGNRIGPFWTEWHMEHCDYVAGMQFRDVQRSGPFAKWEHLHRVIADGPAACTLTDEIHYRLPGGFVGQALAGAFVNRKLRRIFAWRHATTKSDLESVARYWPASPLRIVIAGASGMIGRALTAFLQTQGHTVCRLARRSPVGDSEIFWNPAAGELDAAALEGVDAVINLSGENVGAGRWIRVRRESIQRSRVDATRTLVAAMMKLNRKPDVFVSASAVGYYGDRGDTIVTESGPVGRGFLSDVCREWESHADAATSAGIRTVVLRLGVVLTPAGGALAKLLPLFRAGLGGRVGGGKQWMSSISVDDAVGVVNHALLDKRCHGPMNAVAPTPVTNGEFTETLAHVLRRPAILPVPAWVLRMVFGAMADATVLASTRALPERLYATGYLFRHPTLTRALSHELGAAVSQPPLRR